MRVPVYLVASLFLISSRPTTQEAFGTLAFLDNAGDVNLDGRPDLIVGRWIQEADTDDPGWVIIYSGKNGEVLFEYRGEQKGSGFGTVVAGVGDMNVDGAGDFAIASPLEVVGGRQVGVVRVYSGRTGKLLLNLEGPHPDELFGFSIEGAGDVNQDGMSDIVIGAPLADQQVVEKGKRGKKKTTKKGKSATGAAYVYSGPKGRDLLELYGDGTGDRFGFSVSGAGNSDGDGFGDLLIGAPMGGYAILFSGSDGEPRHRFDGKRGKGSFGIVVSGIGDANQSGTSDAVIASPWASSGGLRTLAGKNGRELWSLPGKKSKTGWWFGSSVDGAGDINADGGSDVVVGDPALSDDNAALLLAALGIEDDDLLDQDPGSGMVRVYTGKKGKLQLEIEPPEGLEGFGLCVSSAGDINQDGADDIAVGFISKEPRARIYSGRNGELLLDLGPGD